MPAQRMGFNSLAAVSASCRCLHHKNPWTADASSEHHTQQHLTHPSEGVVGEGFRDAGVAYDLDVIERGIKTSISWDKSAIPQSISPR